MYDLKPSPSVNLQYTPKPKCTCLLTDNANLACGMAFLSQPSYFIHHHFRKYRTYIKYAHFISYSQSSPLFSPLHRYLWCNTRTPGLTCPWPDSSSWYYAILHRGPDGIHHNHKINIESIRTFHLLQPDMHTFSPLHDYKVIYDTMHVITY